MFQTIEHSSNSGRKSISDGVLRGVLSMLAGAIVIGLLILGINLAG